MNLRPCVALMTDFGNRDPYVGIMKGVIVSIAKDCQIIDLTHEIPPGDIKRGAVFLWQSQSYFPKGTIFLCVVDPGVGTTRGEIILYTQGKTFIGPDNGLFSFICGEEYQVRQISNPALRLHNVSSTFHGRDIFAPAAGFAARGTPFTEFGEQIEDISRLPAPQLAISKQNHLTGEILFADRFGNLITSLGKFEKLVSGRYKFEPWVFSGEQPHATNEFDISSSTIILDTGVSLKPIRTFADLTPGDCGFLVGSAGLLEIVSNQMSAAELLGLGEGSVISLISEDDQWKSL